MNGYYGIHYGMQLQAVWWQQIEIIEAFVFWGAYSRLHSWWMRNDAGILEKLLLSSIGCCGWSSLPKVDVE